MMNRAWDDIYLDSFPHISVILILIKPYPTNIMDIIMHTYKHLATKFHDLAGHVHAGVSKCILTLQ